MSETRDNEQTVCEADDEREVRVCEYGQRKRKTSDAESGICFSARDNEQTVCEADDEHEVRVCEYGQNKSIEALAEMEQR